MKSFSCLFEYEQFIYALPQLFPTVLRSTVVLVRRGRYIGEVSGELTFAGEYRLVIYERLLWHTGMLTLAGYSYEVWRGNKKLALVYNLAQQGKVCYHEGRKIKT